MLLGSGGPCAYSVKNTFIEGWAKEDIAEAEAVLFKSSPAVKLPDIAVLPPWRPERERRGGSGPSAAAVEASPSGAGAQAAQPRPRPGMSPSPSKSPSLSTC